MFASRINAAHQHAASRIAGKDEVVPVEQKQGSRVTPDQLTVLEYGAERRCLGVVKMRGMKYRGGTCAADRCRVSR